MRTRRGKGTDGFWKTYRYTDGLASDYVSCLMLDKDGLIWAATVQGVSVFDGKNWKTYTKDDGLIWSGSEYVFQTRDGAIWISAGEYGVSKFDGKTWKTYSVKDSLVGSGSGRIFQDKENTIWIATQGNGISLYDGEKWWKYTEEDGLANNNVNSIIQDNEGNMCGSVHKAGQTNSMGGRDRKCEESIWKVQKTISQLLGIFSGMSVSTVSAKPAITGKTNYLLSAAS